MSKLLVTPVEAYPIIKGYAVNKSFCDLGSGNNKLCYAMRDIVTQCIGISWVGDENTISGDFTGFLPKAEVYYMWVGCPEFCYEKIKDRLNGILLVGALGFVIYIIRELAVPWIMSALGM